MWHPLTFEPILQERVWGGSRLAGLFGRPVPEGRPVGESWELADLPGAASRVRHGPLAGNTLTGLRLRDPAGLVGPGWPAGRRFPWLCKLLDAREDLSLQVHPPEAIAASLGGEPKTELWYVADALPGSRLLAGLRPGVTREEFAARSRDGTVAGCFHEIPVSPGDVLFLPSGRVHALGAGIVIFEIQQNSDTTYRVFDWNRTGLDGRPRELHLDAALASIDFADFTPRLVPDKAGVEDGNRVRPLARDAVFHIDHVRAAGPVADRRPASTPGVLAAVSGVFDVAGGGVSVTLEPGDFCLLPAALGPTEIVPRRQGELLRVTAAPGSQPAR